MSIISLINLIFSIWILNKFSSFSYAIFSLPGFLTHFAIVQVNDLNMVACDPKSDEIEASHLVDTDSISFSDQTRPDKLMTHNDLDNGLASSNQKDQIFWVNEYRCSLCGIELPPNFVEERQEHFDFHLAEKLQKEESDNSRNLQLNRRYHFMPCFLRVR